MCCPHVCTELADQGQVRESWSQEPSLYPHRWSCPFSPPGKWERREGAFPNTLSLTWQCPRLSQEKRTPQHLRPSSMCSRWAWSRLPGVLGAQPSRPKVASSHPPALCSAMGTERLEATWGWDRSIPTSKGTPGGKRPWRWPHPVYAPQGPEQGSLPACLLPGRSLELWAPLSWAPQIPLRQIQQVELRASAAFHHFWFPDMAPSPNPSGYINPNTYQGMGPQSISVPNTPRTGTGSQKAWREQGSDAALSPHCCTSEPLQDSQKCPQEAKAGGVQTLS